MADVRLRDLNPAEFNFGVNVATWRGTTGQMQCEIVSDGSDAAEQFTFDTQITTLLIIYHQFLNNVGPVAD